MTTKKEGDEKRNEGRIKASQTRQAKGSVHEAIGKLIGDDVARERGSEQKKAAVSPKPASKKPSKH